MNAKLLPPKRPVGITIIAALNMIDGVLGGFLLLLVIYILITKPQLHGSVPPDLFMMTFLGIYGVATGIVGFLLFELIRWAYWSEIALASVYIVYSIFAVLNDRSAFVSSLSSIVFFLIILTYLFMSKKVKTVFRSERKLKELAAR
jgi:uncharacterized membrane protein